MDHERRSIGRVPGPTLGDPIGAALRSHLEARGDASPLYVERDDGLLGIMAVESLFAPPSGEDADWILGRAQGHVLDIGAGAGRFALALKARGHAITALDVSAGAIEVCRTRGLQDAFVGTVEELAERQPAVRFDTFLMMGGNVGLLGDRSAARGLLAAIQALSAPGAIILGEGKDALATNDPLHIAYHAAGRESEHPPGLIRMRVRHVNVASPWMDLLWAPLDELAGLFRENGWEIRDRLVGGTHYLVEVAKVAGAQA